jgi:hypothetical protein
MFGLSLLLVVPLDLMALLGMGIPGEGRGNGASPLELPSFNSFMFLLISRYCLDYTKLETADLPKDTGGYIVGLLKFARPGP